MEYFIINTDGGARGNPGPAGAGVVIWDADGALLTEFGEYLGETTNNVAEYTAVVLALKKLKALIGSKRAKNSSVQMRLDSELVTRQLSGQYRINEEHLKPLFVDVWNLKMDFAGVSFTHVPREQNKAADKMVNEAINRGR